MDFYGFVYRYSSSNNFLSGERGYMVYQTQLYGSNDCGMFKDINSFYSDLRYQDKKAEEEILLSKTQQELFSKLKVLDDLFFPGPALSSCYIFDRLHGTLNRFYQSRKVERSRHLNPSPILRREPWYNRLHKDSCVE